MNRQGNIYTFMYAAVMVIVVAAVLSFVSLSLKDKQKRNVEVEKKQNILASVNVPANADNAEQIYSELITETYVVNKAGDKVEGVDAFNVDLNKENAKPAEKRNLPVFVYTKDGESKLILPVRGKGLWGPVWGYIALNSDKNTIFGAIFDHKGETPGLGAEIAGVNFQKPFAGKKIFDENGTFVSIKVNKAGVGTDIHSVDAISGGTITSKGVEAMLHDCLSNYQAFLKK